MEKPQCEQMALMVPEILLLVATSEGVLTSIERACSLFEDAPGSPKSSTDGSEDSLEFDVLVDSTSGGKYNCGVPFDTTGGGERSFGFGVPMDITGGGEGSFGPGVPLDTTGDEQYTFGVPMDTSGGVEHTDDHGKATNVTPDHEGHKAGSIDYWANTLASAFAPDGPLTAAHREITRLVTLHGVGVHLLNLCLVLHDFPRGEEAAWQRWREHHEAVVPRAHDALLRLSSATSAIAVAEDFLRLRSVLSPRQNDWPSEAKRLVRDARRDIGEARDAVMLMRDAVVREFFETWMILKRSPPLQASC
ncbi:hypothetical protein E2562_036845 [Oryza meyeriana var. granulata]|uniref:Uncharacterized protein n=1 Tax=Oryza meyeriana var. granulata TaxID=110450 RepID=A0A6G1E8H0_9ORYZ|nr:hypothetical protein E2562_036845 [Oryza meyeriana var. granulata]